MPDFSASLPKLNPLVYFTLQERRCACNRERQSASDFMCSCRSWATSSAAPGYVIFWHMLGIKLLSLLLQVETYKSFRPGDIVLAKVVSFTCSSPLGTIQSKYLLLWSLLFLNYNLWYVYILISHNCFHTGVVSPWPLTSDLSRWRPVQLPVDNSREWAGGGGSTQWIRWLIFQSTALLGSTLCEHKVVPEFLPREQGLLLYMSLLSIVWRLCRALCCEPGAQMVPISWCEMQCPRTHAKEFRKVARVQPEYLQAWKSWKFFPPPGTYSFPSAPPKLCLQMFSECWTCLSPGFMSLVFQLHII